MLSIYLHGSSHKNFNNPERHGNISMYNFQVTKLILGEVWHLAQWHSTCMCFSWIIFQVCANLKPQALNLCFSNPW